MTAPPRAPAFASFGTRACSRRPAGNVGKLLLEVGGGDTENARRARALGNLVTWAHGQPTGIQTSMRAGRLCAEVARAGRRLGRMPSDNDGAFRSNESR